MTIARLVSLPLASYGLCWGVSGGTVGLCWDHIPPASVWEIPLPREEDLEQGLSFGLLLYSGSPIVGVYAVRRLLDDSPLFVGLLPKGGNSRVLGP